AELAVQSIDIGVPGTLDLSRGFLALLAPVATTPALTRQMIANQRLFTRAPSLPEINLAELDNRKLHRASWARRTISDGLNSNQLIVAAHLDGDAILDGKGDQQDYHPILAHLGRSGDWLDG